MIFNQLGVYMQTLLCERIADVLTKQIQLIVQGNTLIHIITRLGAFYSRRSHHSFFTFTKQAVLQNKHQRLSIIIVHYVII